MLFKIHVVAKDVSLAPGFFKELERLFSLCRRESKFTDFSAYWWTHRPVGRAGHEPIVWMLPNKASSIIKKVYKDVRIPDDSGGLTKVNGNAGTISEVYMDYNALRTSHIAQAKMAFHELMHNKLQVGDQLHNPSYGNGLNLEKLNLSDDGTQLDWDNKDKMGAALENNVFQYEPPFN